MKVGFTGTRYGMSDRQMEELQWWLASFMELDGAGEFHHGDCIGADLEAHRIAQALGYQVVVHPPEDDKLRAWCVGDVMEPPKPYLVRNHDIVWNTEVLIGAPRTEVPIPHSGTWWTIRHARGTRGRKLIILSR